MSDNVVLKAALEFAAQGIPVLPCTSEKIPYIKGGVHSASTSKETIRNWWESIPNAMLGLATGSSSGIVVVDCDNHAGKDGVGNFKSLCKENSYTPQTKCEKTPSGGQHYYFSVSKGDAPKSVIHFIDGVDFISNGRYIISAPSTCLKGKYELLSDATSIEPCPQWLLNVVNTQKSYTPQQRVVPIQPFRGMTPYSRTVLKNACDRICSSSEGCRNETLFKEACAVYSFVAGGEIEEKEADEKLLQAANKCGLVHEDKNQVERTLQSARNRGFSEPKNSPSSYTETKTASQEIQQNFSDAKTSPNSTYSEGSRNGLFLIPKIDLSLFIPELQKLIIETSNAYGVSPTIAVASLFALGTCLVGQNKALFLRDGWKEKGILWLLIIADSGVGKTHIVKYFFNYLSNIEYRNTLEWKEEYNKYVADKKAYEKKSGKEGEEKTSPPQRPKRVTYTLDDATPESIPKNLEDNPKGLLWKTDEASTLILGFDKYSSTGVTGSTKGRLLTSYDSGAWKTDRVADEKNYYIKSAAVSILTSIQCKELPRVFNKSDENSGFLPRFLFFWAELEKPDVWTDENVVSDESEKLLVDIVDTMTAYTMKTNESGSYEPELVLLTPEAKVLWAKWYNCRKQLVYSLSKNKGEMSAASKVAALQKSVSQAARICLIMHCLEYATKRIKDVPTVSVDTLERSLKLMDTMLKFNFATYTYFHSRGNISVTPPMLVTLMEVIVDATDEILASSGWIYIFRLRELFRKKAQLDAKAISDNAFGTLLSHNFNFEKKLQGSSDKRQWAVNIPKANIEKIENELSPKEIDYGALIDAFWNKQQEQRESEKELPETDMNVSGKQNDGLFVEIKKSDMLQIESAGVIAEDGTLDNEIPSDEFNF